MAQFSQGFLSSLGRPEMSQSLFGLGAAIGGVPGQMKQRQKEQAFNQLMQQAQQAMASGDAAALARIGQQLAAAGYQQEAQQFSKASREASQKAKMVEVGESMLTGLPTRMREGAATLAQMGRIPEALEAQKAAQARQVNKGKQALATFASAKDLNIASPEAKEGFYRIASVYQVPVEDAAEIYDSFVTRVNMTGFDTSRDAGTVKDEDGNLFEAQLVVVKNPVPGQKSTQIIYAPFDPSADAPQKPKGKINIVKTADRTAGEAIQDDLKRRQGVADIEVEVAEDKETAKIFGERKGNAPENFTEASESVRRLTDLKELAEQIETGGFTNEINAGLNKFFNTVPVDFGEFQVLAGQEMIRQLKPIFGGNVSNSEREALADLNASVDKSSEINVVVINRALKEAQKRQNIARYLMNDPSADEFKGYLKALYPEKQETRPKTYRLNKDGSVEEI